MEVKQSEDQQTINNLKDMIEKLNVENVKKDSEGMDLHKAIDVAEEKQTVAQKEIESLQGSLEALKTENESKDSHLNEQLQLI